MDTALECSKNNKRLHGAGTSRKFQGHPFYEKKKSQGGDFFKLCDSQANTSKSSAQANYLIYSDFPY